VDLSSTILAQSSEEFGRVVAVDTSLGPRDDDSRDPLVLDLEFRSKAPR
jgi:hypothetical protein